MDIREKVFYFIRMRGPVLPIEVSKYIEKDLLLTSAMLADLTSTKKIKISHIKVGQSKLYYAPGQEPKLQQFSKHLNSKDLDTYNLLKNKQIFREKTLQPLRRVSVRQLKDFARPLEVTVNGGKEVFWKWYLTKNEDATRIIKDMLGLNKPKPKKVEVKKIPVEQPEVGEAKLEQKSAPKVEANVKKEPATPNFIKKPKEQPKTTNNESTEKQNVIPITIDDDFGKAIKRNFDRKEIKILKSEVQRKNSDIDLEIKIPSSAGELLYYCKAKKKQRVNDGDLASAFVEGQMRKLPVLFVTTGKLTKKAQEKTHKEFASITIMEI